MASSTLAHGTQRLHSPRDLQLPAGMRYFLSLAQPNQCNSAAVGSSFVSEAGAIAKPHVWPAIAFELNSVDVQ